MDARRRAVVGLAVTTVAALVLAGCTAAPDQDGPTPVPATSDAPSAEVPSNPTSPPPTEPTFPPGPDVPPATSEPQDVLTGLTTPWGLAFLPGGALLITERNSAEVVLRSDRGAVVLTGDGAQALQSGTQVEGEGGLLGVAVSPDVEQDGLVYLYRTTSTGNEVVRAHLDAVTGTLGPLEQVLTGIPAAGNHNGGRLAFGPDGFLYVTTGDAGDLEASQDPASLGGKILRVTAQGAPAPGNPVDDSPVWSLGHRNVQGLAWDDQGTMFASEFGQNTYDELNVIVPGGNYGWPEVEGRSTVDGLINPVMQWSTDEASPSGIAVTGNRVHLAALRGERLWTVQFFQDGPGEAAEALVGALGRLRDVVVGPDGALWILTHNTDGRGSPRPGDDRLVRLAAP